jgi:hypothetical protein
MQEKQLVALVQLVHFDSHTIILIRYFCLNSIFINKKFMNFHLLMYYNKFNNFAFYFHIL